MSMLIAGHAVAASLALLLGVVNLVRTPKGDRTHRRIGRVWVAAMYVTILSSFFIRELNPGRFSWIHGLSVFTFVTLSIGFWAALTGHVDLHRNFMRGSYFGTVGAFLGAVVVPQRDIPQLLIHQPWLLSASAFGVLLLAYAVVRSARRPASGSDQDQYSNGSSITSPESMRGSISGSRPG